VAGGSVQVDSSMLADRLPAMCGSDTFTIVVSSTTMNVPSMTAIETIHGLGAARVSVSVSVPASAAVKSYLV
jgi:hypothetical protein